MEIVFESSIRDATRILQTRSGFLSHGHGLTRERGTPESEAEAELVRRVRLCSPSGHPHAIPIPSYGGMASLFPSLGSLPETDVNEILHRKRKARGGQRSCYPCRQRKVKCSHDVPVRSLRPKGTKLVEKGAELML